MTGQSALDEILSGLLGAPKEDAEKLKAEIVKATDKMRFVPNVGPQTDAYVSKADILLFGGQPGGGKTGLLNGLAINEHTRSLIVRKQFTDLEGVIDSARGIANGYGGFVFGNRPQYNRPDGGVIHYQGLAPDDYDTSKQGNPHDLIGIDEGAQLTENQTRMLWGWCRTNKKGQRCRMVIASNPPLDNVGDWMVDFFGPWLDEKHHNPAKPGDLRYFVFDKEGKSLEVDGPEPIKIDGVKYWPHSRTFIPSSLADNPYIDHDDYIKRLQATPEPYRSCLMSGNFMSLRKDHEFQLIPTAWIKAAQERWTERPPEGLAMTTMAVDPAGGGGDAAEIIARYGWWFSKPVTTKGPETADGSRMAALVIQHRRDNCPVIMDIGGGYGGATSLRLRDNGIEVVGFNGATSSPKRTKAGQPFANQRSAAWWGFMEALDPDQEGGAVIALPPDPEILSDLSAPRWTTTARGIQVESKIEHGPDGKITGGLRKRLGRSTGKGDVIVMAYHEGERIVMRQKSMMRGPVKAKLGYQHMKRRH